MKLLLTSGGSETVQGVARLLAPDHEIRLTDRVLFETEGEFVQCALGHDRSTNLLVQGMDAIVHSTEALPGEDVSAQIDAATRCTYNLLLAAHEEGVRRVVLLSTMALMAAYPDDFRVDERWRPLPRTEPPTFTQHLAEQVCREFARERKVSVNVLRLGNVSAEIVAEEIETALTDDSNWSIKHVERN